MDSSIFLIVIISAIVIWLLPFFLVLSSSRVSGSEKLLWILLMLFVSWFAWIFYALFAPLGQRE